VFRGQNSPLNENELPADRGEAREAC
jgi:hypothetical protein